VFIRVASLTPDTPVGKCANYIVAIDSDRDVAENYRSLQELADATPDDVLIRWMTAVTARKLEKHEDTVRHFEQMLPKLDPGPSLLHQSLANAYACLKQYEQALAHHLTAVKLEPAGWSYRGVVQDLIHCGKNEEAVDMRWHLALALRKLGKYEETIEVCKQGAELAPDELHFHWYWAESLSALERYDEALTHYKETIRITPDDAEAYDRAGWVLRKMGDYKAADEMIAKGRELANRNSAEH
jgi:tetratricopeptide (TPR) repeat protein